MAQLLLSSVLHPVAELKRAWQLLEVEHPTLSLPTHPFLDRVDTKHEQVCRLTLTEEKVEELEALAQERRLPKGECTYRCTGWTRR